MNRRLIALAALTLPLAACQPYSLLRTEQSPCCLIPPVIYAPAAPVTDVRPDPNDVGPESPTTTTVRREPDPDATSVDQTYHRADDPPDVATGQPPVPTSVPTINGYPCDYGSDCWHP